MNDNVLKGNEFAKQSKWDLAAMFYERAAKEGDLDGCYELARCYFYGLGKKQDYTEAFNYANLATASGSAESLFLLSRCYLSREDGYASEEFSDILLNEAAKAGSISAMFELGKRAQMEERYEDAEKILIEAFEKENSASTADTLRRFYRETGNEGEADKWKKVSVEMCRLRKFGRVRCD